MENRPAPLRSRRVCRFCLTESEPLSFIYERDHTKPFQVPLTLQIMSCVAIEVYAADGMPQMICNMCRWNLDRSYKFKMQCKKADEALRDYPLSGVLPRPFPPISNDPPADISNKRSAESKLQNETNKKLRTDNDNRDNRDNRERRETRERERDRERQSEKQRDKSNDYYEEDQDGGSEGEQEVNVKEDRKLEPGEIRVHACDQCDRTFPLRQALMLHIVRAHRDRNFKCTECERQFFSKYDLNKHMSTHSDEKPYSCTICQKQFTRLTLLQRHEKVHRDEPRYACQYCDREFFNTEDLEKHEDAMHKKDKPFECNICNKRFQYKQGLERHEMLHSDEKNTYACDYCKEAFHTSTKLARHLSTHAGHRPFMCKLCPRTFLLSHHLTRHMRTHSVEKRHVCEDCGKAFKRKESLEVHQLTHTKRGMGLTCDVCQESCRNRADYVTHIKQHIEAGEKMGPDGLQPENKAKTLELDSEEEEEEEDQYSDNDDDYMPPPYIAKKLPKPPRVQPQQQGSESEEEEDDDEEREEREDKREERQEKEERKEQVVYVRGKDGTMLKKTLKTLMPIQRRDVQEQKVTRQSTPTGSSSQTSSKGSSSSQKEESPKTSRVDDTEAQVQKIVASVFKEHKIPLKHQQNTGQDQFKESATPVTKSQSSQEIRKDGDKTETSTPKSVNTVKVIKRIVLRKSAGGATNNEGTPVSTSAAKDGDAPASETPGSHKVRRVIVRRIIRQGDTTREVIMNPDGTAIDPAELAKLPTGNVVKRVVVKRPLDKSQNLVQTVLQSTEQRPKASDATVANEKFELKTSATSSSGVTSTPKSTVAPQKAQPVVPGQDQETKEKLEQLEKRVEQQRLKIEELQARKAQQDYEAIDEMLPERHDESEDEQQLPLKRVFVKRKQSIYDEEREYNDDAETKTNPNEEEKDEVEQAIKEKTVDDIVEETLENVQKEIQNAPKTTISANSSIGTSIATSHTSGPIGTNKVYTNKRYLIMKTGDTSEVEEMSRELCSILETTDNVVKMQETVLSNLTQISGIATSSTPDIDAENASLKQDVNSMEVDEQINQECVMQIDCDMVAIKNETAMEVEVVQEAEIKLNPVKESAQATEVKEDGQEHATLTLDTQDLSETASIFETSDDVLEVQKSDSRNLEESVIELSQNNDTINLNDTNDSQDSLEDKLSQMEG